MAVRAQYSDTVFDHAGGGVIASASIAVRQVGSATAITETIYADATGATTLSNPLTADTSGRFQFYLLQPKRVDFYVSATGYTAYTVEDVDVGRTDFLTVIKTANQTVNNSATLVDDEHLAFTVGIGDVWAFTLFIKFISGATPDIKFQWSLPAGAALYWSAILGNATAQVAHNANLTQDGTAAALISQFMGQVSGATAAGTAQLKWAQNTANASDTIIYANSYLIAHRLS